MLRPLVACAGAVVLLAVASPVQAQSESVDTLLAMEPSPGVEALLLAHATDGRVGRRWIQLLSSPDPVLRLSAARALGATNVRTSARELLRVLSQERDPGVRAELVQSVAIVGSDDDVLQVYALLDRIGHERAVAMLDGLAAARPSLVAGHLLTVAPLRFNADWVRVTYARIAATLPSSLDAIDAAPTTAGEPSVLEGVIRGATDTRRALPVSLVRAGLGLPLPGRLVAVTYLATVYGTPERAARETGLKPAPDATADDAPEARWAHGLERRWLGDAGGLSLEQLIDDLPDTTWTRSPPRAVLAVLTADERVAFARRFALSAAATRALLDVATGEPAPPDPPPALSVLNDLPVAMLTDVVRLTSCIPQPGGERVTSIRYRSDRRAASLALDRTAWSPGCERAARAAMAMAYGLPPRDDVERALRLVRLDTAFTTCLAGGQGVTSAVKTPAEWGLAPPRKVTDVRPTYPDVAIRSRLQGVVSIDARIEATGCISDARVVRSVHPMLDTAALQAVSQWRYATTTLNGEPVPLLMTVDVTFSLSPPGQP
ncbi:MAG: TonB family protein [Acidobacteria bacterium]|nr:TonB family protein [Acidobacteriota bacterium]